MPATRQRANQPALCASTHLAVLSVVNLGTRVLQRCKQLCFSSMWLSSVLMDFCPVSCACSCCCNSVAVAYALST
jgi:hypothetical protein